MVGMTGFEPAPPTIYEQRYRSEGRAIYERTLWP